MATKGFAVKRNLKAIAEALPTVIDRKIQVVSGPRRLERNFVCLHRIEWDDGQWSTNRARKETFSIDVIFSCQLLGATPEEVEDYVRDVAAEFESAVTADPSIGGLCITANMIPKMLDTNPVDQEYYEAFYVTSVVAECRP